MKKTNAIRELEKAKIDFTILEYEVDLENLDAISVAKKLDQNIKQVFKTLVLKNENKELFVVCIPGDKNIDLKKLSKISKSKKIEMLELKELTTMTGYLRGGCSPVGIKKKHSSYIHTSALEYTTIIVSGGQRGLQVILDPQDLIKYLDMKVDNLTSDK